VDPEIAEDEPPTPGGPPVGEVIRDPAVFALLAVVFLYMTGTFAQETVIGWQIQQISGRPLDLGLAGLAEFLPAALLVIITGWVADRFDRRLITGISIVGELVCTSLLAWYATTNPTAVGPIFLMVLSFGIARAFAAPAERSLKPLVAPEGALPRVVALHSSTFTIALVAGPIIAGLLIQISIAVAYVGCMALTFGGLVALFFVRYRTQPTPIRDSPTLHAALEGLRLIRRAPILLGAISLDLMAVLFGGAVVLLPAVAEHLLHVGSAEFGLLRAAGGVGAGVVAVGLSVKPLHRHVGHRLFTAVAMFGVFTIVLGVSHQLWLSILAVALLQGADMISVFIRATLVPLVTPDELRGRVTAVENVFIGASNQLGAFESGVMAQWLGLTPAIVVGGVGTLAVAGLWAVLFPSLRNVDRFEDVEPITPSTLLPQSQVTTP
jgi:MFS family permease